MNLEIEESRIFEIGGADQVSYGDMMHAYAQLRGLRRVMIPVPVLTPRLSSLWLGQRQRQRRRRRIDVPLVWNRKLKGQLTAGRQPGLCWDPRMI